jgi:hypothetical protein
MRLDRILGVIAMSVFLGACTADPDAPVNQSFPIRQMDGFFNSLSGPPPPAQSARAPDYRNEPGYAPAYPPYDPSNE